MFGRIMKRSAARKRTIMLMTWLARYEGNFGYVIMTGTKPFDGSRQPAAELAAPAAAEPDKTGETAAE
jgi:hypothetical protein